MSGGTPLLDVNVLVALAWPNHIHHARAHEWFAGAATWATCPLTQSGFVRVSANRKAIPDARHPAEAVVLLREMVALPGHRFWSDAVSITDPGHGSFARVITYRQVTDAHVLAIATSHAGCVATFDRGIRELVPRGVDPESAVLLIP
jgi:toxin-antitoxin system PIN domain toxin